METKPSTADTLPTIVRKASNHAYNSLMFNFLVATLSFVLPLGAYYYFTFAEPRPLNFTLNCGEGDLKLYTGARFIVALDYLPWIILELWTFYMEYYKLGWAKSRRLLIILSYWTGFFLVHMIPQLLTEQPMVPPSMTDKLQYADDGVIKCIPPLPSVSSLHYPRYKELGWLHHVFVSRGSRRILSTTYTAMFLAAYVSSFRLQERMSHFIGASLIALSYSAYLSLFVTIRGGLAVSQVILGIFVSFVFSLFYIFFTEYLLYLYNESKPVTITSIPADCVEVKTDKKSMSKP